LLLNNKIFRIGASITKIIIVIIMAIDLKIFLKVPSNKCQQQRFELSSIHLKEDQLIWDHPHP
jgi:hypothetical protein